MDFTLASCRWYKDFNKRKVEHLRWRIQEPTFPQDLSYSAMPLPSMPQKLPSSVSTESIAWFAKWACLQSAMSSDILEAETHKKNKFAVAVLFHTTEKHYSCVCTATTPIFLTLCYRGHFAMNLSHQDAHALLGSEIAKKTKLDHNLLNFTLIRPPASHMHSEGTFPKQKFGILTYLAPHSRAMSCYTARPVLITIKRSQEKTQTFQVVWLTTLQVLRAEHGPPQCPLPCTLPEKKPKLVLLCFLCALVVTKLNVLC